MFTTVFSIGFSMAKNMKIMLVRQQGTKSSIYINNPTEEQVKEVEKIKGINAAGVQIHVDDFFADQYENAKMTVDYYDTTEFKENFSPAISDIEGTYPTKENEIMLSQSALDVLGIKNPKKNMNVRLNFSNAEEKTFVLSGWFKDHQSFSSGSQAFVSEKYTTANNISLEQDGLLSISCKQNKNDAVYNELTKLNLDSSQEISTTFDLQGETSSNTIIIAIAILLIGGIIIVSGYLLIYNVLYISVTKDIRFFGMLKTIGTSPKQIKKIVNMQAFRLSIVGIPVGIILGALTSFVAVPLALTMFNSTDSGAMPTDVVFNPFIYVGTILFALLTIYLSCKKPAKFASNVSPVEALKYNGLSIKKTKAKKTTNGGKLYKMAFRNVFREKKRALLVFASLFMGTIAFLSVNTFLGSLTLENYVNYYIPSDYEIFVSDVSEYEESTRETIKKSIKELEKSIESMNGITTIITIKNTKVDLTFDQALFQPFLNVSSNFNSQNDVNDLIRNYKSGSASYSTSAIQLDIELVKEYNKKAYNKIDLDAFEKGEVAIIGNVDQDGDGDSLLGQTISMTDSETGAKADIKIGSVMTANNNYDIPKLNSYTHPSHDGTPLFMFVSKNFISKLNQDLSIDKFFIDCEKEAEPSITLQMKPLLKSHPAVYAYGIKSEDIRTFQSSITGITILTNGMSIVLIFIGIINFINVMVTGVFTRKQELAVMESIGMTKNQIRKMLMYEGLYYGTITTLLIMSLGNAIIFLISDLTKRIAEYAMFSYPWALVIGIIITIFVICCVVPAVIYKSFSKESVTERLKESE